MKFLLVCAVFVLGVLGSGERLLVSTTEQEDRASQKNVGTRADIFVSASGSASGTGLKESPLPSLDAATLYLKVNASEFGSNVRIILDSSLALSVVQFTDLKSVDGGKNVNIIGTNFNLNEQSLSGEETIYISGSNLTINNVNLIVAITHDAVTIREHLGSILKLDSVNVVGNAQAVNGRGAIIRVEGAELIINNCAISELIFFEVGSILVQGGSNLDIQKSNFINLLTNVSRDKGIITHEKNAVDDDKLQYAYGAAGITGEDVTGKITISQSVFNNCTGIGPFAFAGACEFKGSGRGEKYEIKGGNVNIIDCSFEQNKGRLAGAIHLEGYYSDQFLITNSVFKNNKGDLDANQTENREQRPLGLTTAADVVITHGRTQLKETGIELVRILNVSVTNFIGVETYDVVGQSVDVEWKSRKDGLQLIIPNNAIIFVNNIKGEDTKDSNCGTEEHPTKTLQYGHELVTYALIDTTKQIGYVRIAASTNNYIADRIRISGINVEYIGEYELSGGKGTRVKGQQQIIDGVQGMFEVSNGGSTWINRMIVELYYNLSRSFLYVEGQRSFGTAQDIIIIPAQDNKDSIPYKYTKGIFVARGPCSGIEIGWVEAQGIQFNKAGFIEVLYDIGSTIIHDSVFEDITSIDGEGGVLKANVDSNSVIIIDDVRFIGIQDQVYEEADVCNVGGSAVYVNGGQEIQISDSFFTGNKGTGIHIGNSHVTFTSTEFKNNGAGLIGQFWRKSNIVCDNSGSISIEYPDSFLDWEDGEGGKGSIGPWIWGVDDAIIGGCKVEWRQEQSQSVTVTTGLVVPVIGNVTSKWGDKLLNIVIQGSHLLPCSILELVLVQREEKEDAEVGDEIWYTEKETISYGELGLQGKYTTIWVNDSYIELQIKQDDLPKGYKKNIYALHFKYGEKILEQEQEESVIESNAELIYTRKSRTRGVVVYPIGYEFGKGKGMRSWLIALTVLLPIIVIALAIIGFIAIYILFRSKPSSGKKKESNSGRRDREVEQQMKEKDETEESVQERQIRSGVQGRQHSGESGVLEEKDSSEWQDESENEAISGLATRDVVPSGQIGTRDDSGTGSGTVTDSSRNSSGNRNVAKSGSNKGDYIEGGTTPGDSQVKSSTKQSQSSKGSKSKGSKREKQRKDKESDSDSDSESQSSSTSSDKGSDSETTSKSSDKSESSSSSPSSSSKSSPSKTNSDSDSDESSDESDSSSSSSSSQSSSDSDQKRKKSKNSKSNKSKNSKSSKTSKGSKDQKGRTTSKTSKQSTSREVSKGADSDKSNSTKKTKSSYSPYDPAKDDSANDEDEPFSQSDMRMTASKREQQALKEKKEREKQERLKKGIPPEPDSEDSSSDSISDAPNSPKKDPKKNSKKSKKEKDDEEGSNSEGSSKGSSSSESGSVQSSRASSASKKSKKSSKGKSKGSNSRNSKSGSSRQRSKSKD